MVSLDPGPLTLRELAVMAEGRGRLEWSQTAELLAMLRNVNRGKDDKPVTGDDFNPYAKKKPKKPAAPKKMSFAPLAAMFGKVKK